MKHFLNCMRAPLSCFVKCGQGLNFTYFGLQFNLKILGIVRLWWAMASLTTWDEDFFLHALEIQLIFGVLKVSQINLSWLFHNLKDILKLLSTVFDLAIDLSIDIADAFMPRILTRSMSGKCRFWHSYQRKKQTNQCSRNA